MGKKFGLSLLHHPQQNLLLHHPTKNPSPPIDQMAYVCYVPYCDMAYVD